MSATQDTVEATPKALYQRIGLVLGPTLALLMLAIALGRGELADPAWRVAALTVWMAAWWATEAVPVPVTAMLPLALLPLGNVASIKEIATPYANPIIYLFMGGFMLALAVERAHLHRRVALWILQHTGGSASSLIGGFMLSAALISMWVYNTATTLMLLPTALALVGVIEETVQLPQRERREFPIALLLGIAYGATIGGMATLVGTAPNAYLAAFMLERFQVEVGFINWMIVSLPLCAMMLFCGWIFLTRLVFSMHFRTSAETRNILHDMLRDMGAMSSAERRVSLVFLCVGLCWMLRPLIRTIPGLEGVSDAGIAMTGAVALFLIPSGMADGHHLLDWKSTTKMPWGLLVLFGGGLSLANAIGVSGLADNIGAALHPLSTWPPLLLILIITAMVILLTELVSNTATTATFLPILAAVAVETGQEPLLMLFPVAIAASCAFMLPVATPPNAIVYGSERLRIPDMARAGLPLNIVGILLVTAFGLLLAPYIRA